MQQRDGLEHRNKESSEVRDEPNSPHKNTEAVEIQDRLLVFLN
jgi:hypothetical protein